MADHYATLGVPRDADAATIKAAHRTAAKRWHPDVPGGDKERYQQVQQAYDTLSDPDRRAHYDRTGEDGTAARSELAEIAPLVIGAFDRAIVEALSGSAPKPGMWGSHAKGLGKTDMVAAMVRLLGEDKQRGEEANKQIAHESDRLREMQRRIGWRGEEGKNILASTLAQRLQDGEQLTAKNLATIALIDRAVEHVKLYGWELDPVAPPAPPVRDWMTFDHWPTPPRRMPIMPPGIRIKLAPAVTKAPKRRTAALNHPGGFYARPHTCTLDAEGKQVPAKRGSWARLERAVANLQWTMPVQQQQEAA